jgi:hypothetical protein
MINLSAFCLKDQDRHYSTSRSVIAAMMRPWRDGDWVYATNGKSAVRVPATPETLAQIPDAPEGAESLTPPPVASMMQALDFSLCTAPLPSLRPDPRGVPREAPCDDCGTCEACGGEGTCLCSQCENEHDCGQCDGKGTVCATKDCKTCRGEGVIREERWKTQPVGSRWFSCQLLEILHRELRGILYSPDGDRNTPLIFTASDGVQGMAMPLHWNDASVYDVVLSVMELPSAI